MHEITLHDVTRALTGANLAYKIRGRYIVSQCPLHDDRRASCQIFLDDWFCSCLAGCGRFPITKPFPELRGWEPSNNIITLRSKEIEYRQYDLSAAWRRLPLIPRAHKFKGLPLSTLDELGWRYDEAKNGYFIPYFNQSRDTIPFAQWRYLQGGRRFSFLAGARPTLYGKWNIAPGERLFIVEGTSDCAVLERCGIPWIGVPSASNGTLLKNFAVHARRLGIGLIYAGDNDEAGAALKRALDDSRTGYRTRQPPTAYKDWGEFYERQGDLSVLEWAKPMLEE